MRLTGRSMTVEARRGSQLLGVWPCPPKTDALVANGVLVGLVGLQNQNDECVFIATSPGAGNARQRF